MGKSKRRETKPKEENQTVKSPAKKKKHDGQASPAIDKGKSPVEPLTSSQQNRDERIKMMERKLRTLLYAEDNIGKSVAILFPSGTRNTAVSMKERCEADILTLALIEHGFINDEDRDLFRWMYQSKLMDSCLALVQRSIAFPKLKAVSFFIGALQKEELDFYTTHIKPVLVKALAQAGSFLIKGILADLTRDRLCAFMKELVEDYKASDDAQKKESVLCLLNSLLQNYQHELSATRDGQDLVSEAGSVVAQQTVIPTLVS